MMETVCLRNPKFVEATNRSREEEKIVNENKEILLKELEPSSINFMSACNDKFILTCHTSFCHQNKLFQMFNHNGIIILEWQEPIN